MAQRFLPPPTAFLGMGIKPRRDETTHSRSLLSPGCTESSCFWFGASQAQFVCVWLRKASWEGMLGTSTARVAHKGLKVKNNHLDECKDELTKADPARDWDHRIRIRPKAQQGAAQPTAGSLRPLTHKAASVSLGRAEAAAASPGTTGKQTPGLSRGWEFVFLNIT